MLQNIKNKKFFEWIKKNFKVDNNIKTLFLRNKKIDIHKILSNPVYTSKDLLQNHESTKFWDIKQCFFLLSGPVFANSLPHLGTAMNHIIKDVIVNIMNIYGKISRLIPGWDVHGMPIIKETEELYPNLKRDSNQFLIKCREVVHNNIHSHQKIFNKLGIICDTFYTTLDKEFVLNQLNILLYLIKNKLIYLKYSPIKKCIKCGMVVSLSDIHTKTKNKDQCFFVYKTELEDLYLLVWTTTPWTIANNLNIAVSDHIQYVKIFSSILNKWIVCSKNFTLKFKHLFDDINIQNIQEIDINMFKHLKYYDVLIDQWKNILFDHNVIEDKGTGVLHLSPFHSMTDYNILKQHNIIKYDYNVLFDHFGRIIWNKSNLECKTLYDLNKQVLIFLQQNKLLLHYVKQPAECLVCYRCDSVLVSLYSRNCFVNFLQSKREILNKLDTINLIPKTHETFKSIVNSRQVDWCISRERTWGVPLCLFYCLFCRKNFFDLRFLKEFMSLIKTDEHNYLDFVLNFETIKKKCSLIKCKFCDSSKDIIPEKTVMDVWFDSASVVSNFLSRDNISKIDLIVEGNDQYRGWFQHILILQTLLQKTQVNNILIHGFVKDKNKNKLSKSKKNSDINVLLKEFHPDVIRFWVCSNNIIKDIIFDIDVIKQTKKNFTKILLFLSFIINNLWMIKISWNNLINTKWSMIEWMILFRLKNHIILLDNCIHNNFEIHIFLKEIFNTILFINSYYLEGIKNNIYTIEGEKEYDYFNHNTKNISSYQSLFRILLIFMFGGLMPIIPFSLKGIMKEINLSDYFLEDFKVSEMFRKIRKFLLEIKNNHKHDIQKLMKMREKIYSSVDKYLKLSYDKKKMILVYNEKFIKEYNIINNENISIFFNVINCYSNNNFIKSKNVITLYNLNHIQLCYVRSPSMCVRCHKIINMYINKNKQEIWCNKCQKYFV